MRGLKLRLKEKAKIDYLKQKPLLNKEMYRNMILAAPKILREKVRVLIESIKRKYDLKNLCEMVISKLKDFIDAELQKIKEILDHTINYDLFMKYVNEMKKLKKYFVNFTSQLKQYVAKFDTLLSTLLKMRIPSKELLKYIPILLQKILSMIFKDSKVDTEVSAEVNDLIKLVDNYQTNISTLTDSPLIVERAKKEIESVIINSDIEIECPISNKSAITLNLDDITCEESDESEDEIEKSDDYYGGLPTFKAKIVIPDTFSINKSMKLGTNISLSGSICENREILSPVSGKIEKLDDNTIIIDDYADIIGDRDRKYMDDFISTINSADVSKDFILNLLPFFTISGVYLELGLSKIQNPLKKDAITLYRGIVKDEEGYKKKFDKDFNKKYGSDTIKNSLETGDSGEISSEIMGYTRKFLNSVIQRYQNIKIGPLYYIPYETNKILYVILHYIRLNDSFFVDDRFKADADIVDNIIKVRCGYISGAKIISDEISLVSKWTNTTINKLKKEFESGKLDDFLKSKSDDQYKINITSKKLKYLLTLLTYSTDKELNYKVESEMYPDEMGKLADIADKYISMFKNSTIDVNESDESNYIWNVYDSGEYKTYEYIIDDINNEEYKKIISDDYKSKKYWRKYLSLASLVGIPFMATGLLLMGSPIPFPVLYNPIRVINTDFGIIVIGLSVCGVSFTPLILYVNMKNEFLPIVKTPDVIAHEKYIRKVAKDYVSIVERAVKDQVKTINEFNDMILDEFKKISNLDLKIEPGDSKFYELDGVFKMAPPLKKSMFNNISINNANVIYENINNYTQDLIKTSNDLIMTDHVGVLMSHAKKYIGDKVNQFVINDRIIEIQEKIKNIKSIDIRPLELKLDINKQTDKMQALLANIPNVILSPNSISFGVSMKRPNLSNIVDVGIDEVFDMGKIMNVVEKYQMKGEDLLSDKLNIECTSNEKFMDNIVSPMLLALKINDSIPKYSDLSPTNVFFMKFLTTSFCPEGAFTYGLPNFPPIKL